MSVADGESDPDTLCPERVFGECIDAVLLGKRRMRRFWLACDARRSSTLIGKPDLGCCEIRSRVFLRTREPRKEFESVRGPARIVWRCGI